MSESEFLKRRQEQLVESDFEQVIDQLNQRFGLHMSASDERMARLKSLYPILLKAAQIKHGVESITDSAIDLAVVQECFDSGRMQMLVDVMICVLENEGVINRGPRG